MPIKLNDSYTKGLISDGDLEKIGAEISAADDVLRSGTGAGSDFLGWLTLPSDYDRDEFSRIKAAANKIKASCDVFIVIGIGGSYLGARAAIEFVKSPLYNNIRKDTPDIYFAGNNISSQSISELLGICEGRDVCINVISKSGTTTEPAVAFRIFREYLEKRYGADGSKERIFVTTDKCRGTLKAFSDKRGYETFVVPDNIGGRYSVLTAVGLLPIAVAGIDIDSMMNGALDASRELTDKDIFLNPSYRYAALRNILYRKGRSIEILVGYEPSLLLFNEWWKQLYGESEGKDGKGLYPSSVIFSTDLHSLGQYIQQGTRNIFETVINVRRSSYEVTVPNDSENIDGLNFLSGKTLEYVNHTAMNATLIAHNDGNVPNIVIDFDDLSAYTFGYAVYFFELACAVSGYVLGVNPFDQPGVEAYKKNMFALLGKPGYEEMGDSLRARIL